MYSILNDVCSNLVMSCEFGCSNAYIYYFCLQEMLHSFEWKFCFPFANVSSIDMNGALHVLTCSM